MKTLKFTEALVPLVESGQKTTTFRLFDDKDLQVGDVVTVFVKETGYQFGIMTITEVITKPICDLIESDWSGHERYESEEAMYAEFKKYYGDGVGPETELKIIRFRFEPKLYKKCVVVNENDEVLGAEYIAFAIQKGLIRRAARVYVFNESGQLLVQQRSKHVLKPLMLDQSAAGHVDEGETYEEAAKRELFEELGIGGVVLTPVALSFRTADFYNGIYRAVVPNDQVINFDPEELAGVFWYNIEQLEIEMKSAPERFTPAFKDAWQLLGKQMVTV